MKHQALPPSRPSSVVWSVVLCLALWVSLIQVPVLVSQEERPDYEPRQAQEAPVEPSLLPPGVSGQRVYLDPTTGRLLAEPPPGTPVLRLTERELSWLSTSHDGLEQQVRPGGGFWLDLQGRFRHLAVAVIGPDGQISVHEASGDASGPSEEAPEESKPPSTPPEPSSGKESEPRGDR